VFVFDLDGLVWDPEMYQLGGGSPFVVESDHVLRDRHGTKVHLLGDLPRVLQEIQDMNGILAIASSTDEPSWAMECLEKFSVNGKALISHFPLNNIVIQKGSKAHHLTKIASITGLPAHKIVFFDNESWCVFVF